MNFFQFRFSTIDCLHLFDYLLFFFWISFPDPESEMFCSLINKDPIDEIGKEFLPSCRMLENNDEIENNYESM